MTSHTQFRFESTAAPRKGLPRLIRPYADGDPILLGMVQSIATRKAVTTACAACLVRNGEQ